jgi:hypothetical protein
MAENIVAGLFGLTPEMYGEQQRRSALQEGITLAQLDPAARGAAMTYAGARGLGNAIGGALGAEDPQLKMISARNSIAQQIDQSDPESIIKGAQMLAQMGDQQGAMALAQYARQAQGDVAQTKQRLAAALASEATAKRERQQATPNDIQIANEIATLEDTLSQIEGLPADPERTRAKNLLNTRLSELRRLTAKGEKATAANIKEVGVAETTREPVYLDVNNDQQFIYKQGPDGKQVRVPFTGGVDRKISETKVTATASSKGAEEGAKTIAELDAKRLGAAQVSSGKAVEQAGLLQELLKTPQPISGSGAPARVGALRVFSTFGLTSPKDDEALQNADKFNALAGERVISFIKALGSNPTDTDREFARTIGPALEKGTKTNTDLINFLLERSRKVVKDAESLETHFYNNNYSLRGYKSPFLSDLETPKSKASDLTTEELQRIARGKK